MRSLLFALIVLCPVLAFSADTILTPAQIEADWLNPESLRQAAGLIEKDLGKATREQDAAGGCDGIIDGKWGFHTEDEDRPWWQVDLGKAMTLDRVVLYNRCDSGMGQRNARIQVLVSPDGKNFTKAYQHDGTAFYGHSDKKPLTATIKGVTGRYVRLQLPGKSYFHLDEVEIFPVGENRNVALHKPATQSSISQWSALHTAGLKSKQAYPTASVIARGFRLAKDLSSRKTDVQQDVAKLEELKASLQNLKANDADGARQIYLQARWAVRHLALRNPLLDFDHILFAQSAPGRFPHMSDQFYGWWSRPGGGIFVLENFKSASPSVRCLTSDFPPGSYLRPDLSYDGKKVLFAYCKFFTHVPDLRNKADKANVPEEAFYHIYEMNVDGSERRQLTHGRYDDFDGRYLPSGDIVFLSTRKGSFLQCTKASTAATGASDLPDSYVRCGGDNYRPVPVFTLHLMDSHGGNLRPLSAFENFEWTPAVANDGRILYTRWDYIDRFNGPFFSLWSTNPDGSNPQLVYGNYTVRPQVVCEAVAIPRSHKLMFVATAHHSILGGSLALFDRNYGTEEAAPLVRLTPEVPFPETEGWANSYYANPWPLSEEHYLVGWSNRKLPPHSRVDSTDQNPVNAMGVYLYDAFGNLTLLYRDQSISSGNPVPVRPRAKPPVYTGDVAWDEPQEGSFLVQNVYHGLAGIRKGTVKSLRVIAVPPKTQPHMNSPNLGVSSEDPGKILLGTVPVEADGSAFFRVPSGVPVFFQAVDQEGLGIQTMRSLTYVWPKQTLSCVGCHESRDAAPQVASLTPLASLREPSRLAPGPDGTWPLSFDRLVQPVLDRACVNCHGPGSTDLKAAGFDLTRANAYDNLLAYADKDLRKLAFEKDRSFIGDCGARRSKLLALLKDENRHAGVKVDQDTLSRLVIWMDLYAQRQGHFSPQQEQQLREFRSKISSLLAQERGR